jgi:hypothetical protein
MDRISKDDLNLETVFDEPVITDVAAFDRFCCYVSQPRALSKQFEEFAILQKKLESDVNRHQVFLFPDHLTNTAFTAARNTTKGSWMMESTFTEQIVFDLRTPLQKRLQA